MDALEARVDYECSLARTTAPAIWRWVDWPVQYRIVEPD